MSLVIKQQFFKLHKLSFRDNIEDDIHFIDALYFAIILSQPSENISVLLQDTVHLLFSFDDLILLCDLNGYAFFSRLKLKMVTVMKKKDQAVQRFDHMALLKLDCTSNTSSLGVAGLYYCCCSWSLCLLRLSSHL